MVYAGCVGVKAGLRRGNDGVVGAREDGAGDAGRLDYLHLPCAPTARSMAAIRSWYAERRLRRVMGGDAKGPVLLWLYHPALLPLGRELFPDAPVVYDVMDRFTAFTGSAQAVAEQELRALEAARIVFTGGRSIDRAIRSLAEGKASAPIHCFPSGVDLDHFARALEPDLVLPEDLALLPRPVFGYFGAVDERIDFELLAALGTARPDGSVVVVGPLLSQPAAEMPPNVHFLGGRPYEELPRYLAGFDVCLLPFRNTPLVAHVSPTKTPEYLAGGRPVVSTPIPDVVSDYGEVVRVAQSREEFIAACSDLATARPEALFLAAEARRRAMTWDQIAERMDELTGRVK